MARKRPRGNRKPEAVDRRIERVAERRGADAGSPAPPAQREEDAKKAAEESARKTIVETKEKSDEVEDRVFSKKARKFWERPWTKEAVELDAALP